jgi:hypothetical protein
MRSPVIGIYTALHESGSEACARVVPILQLKVLRDKCYDAKVFAAARVRQLKGNRGFDAQKVHDMEE